MPEQDDPRQDSPAYHRNVAPILEVLDDWLADATGEALEVASGSGQHAVAFARAFPRLRWWPSELAARRCESIDARRADAALANLMPAQRLDVGQRNWPLPAALAGHSEGLALIIAVNLIHIAPWSVTLGLLEGAGRHLAPGGQLVLYGPFKRDGAHTAPSNARFDDSLRSQDASWGVRDLEAVIGAGAPLLAAPTLREMPANNLMLSLRRG
ncbi:MAG: DUF938 domain-containing protein [Pseudomonadales bacterium]|jgi:SAM-dependent methyltransferase|nr:DUF938 domain-containing protein [Pseudomonadales bacterium]